MGADDDHLRKLTYFRVQRPLYIPALCYVSGLVPDNVNLRIK